jgi:hypothetical protein
MSYSSLVDKNLKRAFNLVKDLATEVTFNKKTIGDFDFATGDAPSETSVPVTTKIVVLKNSKGSSNKESRNAATMEVMADRKAIGSLTAYDTVTINAETWKIGTAIKDDGYISVLMLHKEA